MVPTGEEANAVFNHFTAAGGICLSPLQVYSYLQIRHSFQRETTRHPDITNCCPLTSLAEETAAIQDDKSHLLRAGPSQAGKDDKFRGGEDIARRGNPALISVLSSVQ